MFNTRRIAKLKKKILSFENKEGQFEKIVNYVKRINSQKSFQYGKIIKELREEVVYGYFGLIVGEEGVYGSKESIKNKILEIQKTFKD